MFGSMRLGISIRACLAVIGIGRCDRYLPNQRCIGVRANMGLVPMNSPLSLVLYPSHIIVALTGGGNDGGIDQCPCFDGRRLGFELHGHRLKQCPVNVGNYPRLGLHWGKNQNRTS